jgi:hypothetical protein
MPRYFIEFATRPTRRGSIQLSLLPKNQSGIATHGISLHRVFDARMPNSRQVEVVVDDFELFLAALSSIAEVSIQGNGDLKIDLRVNDQIDAVELVLGTVDIVDKMCKDISCHRCSQLYVGKLEFQVIRDDFDILSDLSESYGVQLDGFENDTHTRVGLLFREFVNFNPDDDLTKEYHLLDGTRKLVIPHLGNYNRINLPDELKCANAECSLGKYTNTVIELNNLVSKIDWKCLQIAHKMKDHQETDNPNGPHWVI